jgi:hypothetical protein
MASGNSVLSARFLGDIKAGFLVPYVLCLKNNQCSVASLALDSLQRGELQIKNFGKDVNFLVLMPVVVSKTSGFDGKELSFNFSITAKTEPAPVVLASTTLPVTLIPAEQTLEQKKLALKAQILVIQQQIASLQEQLLVLSQGQVSCLAITESLKIKSQGPAVKCLQKFLKQQGQAIYPEGLITGYFGELTELAVKRFQEKYKDEILKPLGMEIASGVVGPSTRAKINQLLRQSTVRVMDN